MLTAETKRHIDNARDILVGVVPNPTAQIDQITNALIYKFMDDMDQAAIKTGGEASFFTGDLEQYAWTRLMSDRLGNQERLNLYAEALVKFSTAKQLPQLFRDIFKSAFLPHRSPEVLGLFLKEMSYFDYAHSEELGNAYEYLLSIMSSQGDAGQFRTPRNIINFIVKAVNPTKADKVLDPACGTAGFLISAYKHILAQHDGKDDPEKKEKHLTPEERKKLFTNFEGYDIDPTMVRIAQVNMYLHQFKNPKVGQYDTLSQEERWGEKYDVILANPPFMSPRGGIRPHNKFSIQSTRSEVLFVDYIVNHLKPKGRAGIIVPEGIIFKSDGAVKQLRKALVEDGLYAVVSLPSGIFNPYAGVKTSILLFDNEHAKQTKELLFISISKDGYDLGAQRRPLCSENENEPEWCPKHSDLPEALEIIEKWRKGEKVESGIATYVEKAKIAESGDYNLSANRYIKLGTGTGGVWPMVELGEVCDTYQPKTITSTEILESGPYKVFGANGVIGYYDEFNHEDAEVAVTCRGATCGTVNYTEPQSWITGNAMVVKPKSENLNKRFLYYVLSFCDLSSAITGAAQPQITATNLRPYKIPLPPLEVQLQIVAELDGYQKIIDGARQIVTNWRPSFTIDPEWKRSKLEAVCTIKSGGTPSTTSREYYDGGTIPWLKSEVCKDAVVDAPTTFITEAGIQNSSAKWLEANTTLIALVGATIGKTALITFPATTNQNIAGLTPINVRELNPWYLFYVCQTLYQEFIRLGDGGFKMANLSFVKGLEIPLPPLEVQQQIVDTIEAERTYVESARALIDLYTHKTKIVIAKLWSE